ncbi:MAG: hypothetical protein ACI36Z_08425 [Alloprevotella sp.]
MNTHTFQHAFCILQGHIRRFSKAFPNFWTAFSHFLAKKTRKFEDNLEEKEQNMPFGNNRTSDFFASNIRTFHAKHPYFTSKKSVLSAFPNENRLKTPVIHGYGFKLQTSTCWLGKPFSGIKMGRFPTIPLTTPHVVYILQCKELCRLLHSYIYYIKGDIQQQECEEGSFHAVLPPARNAWPYP